MIMVCDCKTDFSKTKFRNLKKLERKWNSKVTTMFNIVEFKFNFIINYATLFVFIHFLSFLWYICISNHIQIKAKTLVRHMISNKISRNNTGYTKPLIFLQNTTKDFKFQALIFSITIAWFSSLNTYETEKVTKLIQNHFE